MKGLINSMNVVTRMDCTLKTKTRTRWDYSNDLTKMYCLEISCFIVATLTIRKQQSQFEIGNYQNEFDEKQNDHDDKITEETSCGIVEESKR